MIKIESQKMLVRFEAEIEELELSYDKRSDNMAIEGNQSKQAVQVESEMMNEVDRQSSGDVSLSLSKEAVASKKQTRSIHKQCPLRTSTRGKPTTKLDYKRYSPKLVLKQVTCNQKL
ncbi:hypothetical protein YC2023_092944 [Brassica napus]